MKIIAVLESNISAGGAFNQGLNAILLMQRICRNHFDFEVLSTQKSNFRPLAALGIRSSHVTLSRLDYLLGSLSHFALVQRLQRRLKIYSSLERAVKERKGDLVYFLTQSAMPRLLQDTNFIMTMFDLCHRDTPEFPEVRSFGVFRSREEQFRNYLPLAIAIVTESQQLSETIVRRYGIDQGRCLTLPMEVSPFLRDEHAVATVAVLKKYNLEKGYFFYPAQFWAHKNHIRILEALERLRSRGVMSQVVFVGGDQGNREHVERAIGAAGLGNQVHMLGFVPAEDMRGLYDGCRAVLMPTYFGPTNLPPLEAWLMSKPLIYSSHLIEHAGSAAFYCDPDSAVEVADAMQRCDDPNLVAAVTNAGIERLSELSRLRQDGEKAFRERLAQYAARRRCWA